MLNIICESSAVLRTIYVLNFLKLIIFVIVPSILIIIFVKDFIKVILEDEKISDAFNLMLKKLIAAGILYLLPSFFLSLVSIFNNNASKNIENCLNMATLENINYYEKLESVERIFMLLENNPTQANFDAAQKRLSEISIKDAESYEDYILRLSLIKVEVNRYENVRKCTKKGGNYVNGYCVIPTYKDLNSGGDSSVSSLGVHTMDPSNLDSYDSEYLVINSKIDVKKYHQIVQAKKIMQTLDTDKYGSSCLTVSCIHAYSLYTANTSLTLTNQGSTCSIFETFTSDNKQDVLTAIYLELAKNNPVILQVNGNKAGTSRHFVTVIGLKKSVKNSASLKEEDLLILDSWDGKIERMDKNNSRFMTTGKACGKDYSGYRIQKIEE